MASPAPHSAGYSGPTNPSLPETPSSQPKKSHIPPPLVPPGDLRFHTPKFQQNVECNITCQWYENWQPCPSFEHYPRTSYLCFAHQARYCTFSFLNSNSPIGSFFIQFIFADILPSSFFKWISSVALPSYQCYRGYTAHWRSTICIVLYQ